MQVMSSDIRSSTDSLHSAVKAFTSQLSAPKYKDHDPRAVTASALILLRQLPVARNAVLSYFGRQFDEAANRYLQAQVDRITGTACPGINLEEKSNETLQPIAVNFQELIEEKLWASQLSKWAIDLLGHISKKLMSTNAAPIATSVSTVEEKLELWMSCSATKILIDITSSCFSALVDNPSSVDSCVESLLEASIKYAPHFDWVVAHLGSCFPVTIIDRVLVAGFKDFFSPGQQSSKFASAAAILGYLSAQHKQAAILCVNKYFHAVLNQPPPSAAAGVTFLLNVASVSPMMIRAMTADLARTLNIQTLNKLAAHFTVGLHDLQSLLRLSVHLILRLDQTSYTITNLLLDLAYSHSDMECGHEPLRQEVKNAAQSILVHLISELNRVTICSRSPHMPRVELPYMKTLSHNSRALIHRLARSRTSESEGLLVCRLLLCISWHSSRTCAVEILNELLSISTPWMLPTFDTLLQQLVVRYPDMLVNLTSSLLCFQPHNPSVLDNLSKYIMSRSETANLMAEHITRNHLPKLSQLIGPDGEHLTLYSDLIGRFGSKHPSYLSAIDTLTTWFFESLSRGKLEQLSSLRSSILSISGCSSAALGAVLRGFVSKAMEPAYCTLLGGPAELFIGCMEEVEEVSLSKLNSDLLKRPQLPAYKSYMLHNEHVGRGKRLSTATRTPEEIYCATQHLLTLVSACCEQPSEAYNVVLAKQLLVSIILEAVSPDIIALRTKWLEPITHERELSVRRALDSHPFIWHLLSYCCSHSACFLSACLLVRCYLATLVTAWSTCRGTKASNCPKELEASHKVILLLLRANALPVPLSHSLELIPLVTSYEMRIIFDIIFRHVQNAVNKGLTVIDLEQDDLKTIQSIVQQNIGELYRICPKFMVTEHSR